MFLCLEIKLINTCKMLLTFHFSFVVHYDPCIVCNRVVTIINICEYSQTSGAANSCKRPLFRNTLHQNFNMIQYFAMIGALYAEITTGSHDYKLTPVV